MKTKQSAKAKERKESRKLLTAGEREQIKARLAIIEETLILCPKAHKSVSDLIRLAEGEVAKGEIGLATHCLLCFTTDLAGALNKLASDRPELFQPVARKSFIWPVVNFAKKALNRRSKELMSVLQLGKDSVWTNRKWHTSAPSTCAANVLYVTGQALERAGRLPPLTSKSKRQWFEESWKSQIDRGFKPEESERLAPLGKAKATKRPKYCKGLHKKTRDANVRAEIKARIWDAFDKLIAG